MKILLIYNIILIYLLYKSDKKKKIYYNNYKQCLRALADRDPMLKAYLEKEK